MLRFAGAGLALMLGTQAGWAQPRPAVSRSQFEVASIKPNNSGDLPIGMGPIGNGRFRCTNAPLRELVTMAYRIKGFQLAGAPGWLASERYDVEAKAGSRAGSDELVTMLQPLLEERLRLRFHYETKVLPAFSLAVAKPGKLIGVEGECTAAGGPPDPRNLPHGPCGSLFILPGHVMGQKVPIGRLSDALSRLTDRLVVDRTGLSGMYDIELAYTPEHVPPAGAAPPGMPPLPPVDPHGPSLFTALQEQLGLKLESRRAPVKIMVIDHVERPDGSE